MTILYKAILFYGVAGVVMGCFLSTMSNVSFTFTGKRTARYPRIAIFLTCLIFWPAFFWQLIFKGW
jgi:hypothetical protein